MATKPLRIFHLFPRLPHELQTLIWTHTLPPPQIIPLHRETFPSSKLAHMTRRIDYDRENRMHREAGYYFTSFCCPPVLLHISHHARQLALSCYQQCFTLEENEEQDIRLWYEALRIFWDEWEEDNFWEEWEGDENDSRREFFEKEKAVFDEAKDALEKGHLNQEGLLKMKRYNSLIDKSPIYKAKWFAQAKRFFEEGKQFMGKVKRRPGGIWFRPNCDTVFLRRNEIQLLPGWKGWKAGNMRSLAVEKFSYGEEEGGWFVEEGEEIWRALFGRQRRLRDENENDAETNPALFTGLEELIIVDSHGYHSFRDGMLKIDYHEETDEKLKQECHDRTLSKLQEDSALMKVPEVKGYEGRRAEK